MSAYVEALGEFLDTAKRTRRFGAASTGPAVYPAVRQAFISYDEHSRVGVGDAPATSGSAARHAERQASSTACLSTRPTSLCTHALTSRRTFASSRSACSSHLMHRWITMPTSLYSRAARRRAASSRRSRAFSSHSFRSTREMSRLRCARTASSSVSWRGENEPNPLYPVDGIDRAPSSG